MCKHLFHSFSPAVSFSASCPKLYQKMCHILGCLEGVLEVSGGYLSDRGYCVGEYVVGSIEEEKTILGHFNQLQHFLPMANFRRF